MILICVTKMRMKVNKVRNKTMCPAEEAIYEQAVLSGNYMEARRVSWNAPDLKDASKAVRLLELIEADKA